MERSEVKIETEFIKLDQLLKFSGMAFSGAEAKSMVLDGIIKLNGEVCTIRGKKVRPGDVVTVEAGDVPIEITVI